MSNNYSVTSASYLGNPESPNATVWLLGEVNNTYVGIEVFVSALNQAFAAGGITAVEVYLAPLMLAASDAFYAYAGVNPTFNSSTPLNSSGGPVYPSSMLPTQWAA